MRDIWQNQSAYHRMTLKSWVVKAAVMTTGRVRNTDPVTRENSKANKGTFKPAPAAFSPALIAVNEIIEQHS